MSLLEAHLEQIKCSCQGIDSLPFPPPKIFTNALLSNHEITSLIRDTEAHERALFSVPAPPLPSPATAAGVESKHGNKDENADKSKSNRRRTIFNVASGEVTTGPPDARRKRHTAVAAVLGGEMHEQLRRGETDRKGDLDIEVLLRGAEKLCGVYELPGARERIAQLRSRQLAGRNTMAYYEAKVAEQADRLAAMNADWMGQGGEAEGAEEEDVWTEEDLRREEEEARLMEAKKRELQARLRSMEQDLGGLRGI